MSQAATARPESSEYAPYYGRYIDQVPENDVVSAMEKQLEDTLALLGTISEEQSLHRYEPGKWSIREVLGHILDAERIFAYRALRFARGDKNPLPGFEENDYIRKANFDAVPLAELAAEFALVRRANLYLFRHLAPEAWSRTGVASGWEVSVRALAYMLVGHERHHVKIVRERYLNQ